MKSLVLTLLSFCMFSSQAFGLDLKLDEIKSINQFLDLISMSEQNEELDKFSVNDEFDNTVNYGCDESFPPGGWISFPLACRTFVGELEIATDSNFKHTILKTTIVQKGVLKRNNEGDFEYYLLLKLGKVNLPPEKVEWQSDRNYKIGKKIQGKCDLIDDTQSSSVVCKAGFHGFLGRIAGGYVETYYGPGITKIELIYDKSQEGRKPLFKWRAQLSELK